MSNLQTKVYQFAKRLVFTSLIVIGVSMILLQTLPNQAMLGPLGFTLFVFMIAGLTSVLTSLAFLWLSEKHGEAADNSEAQQA